MFGRGIGQELNVYERIWTTNVTIYWHVERSLKMVTTCTSDFRRRYRDNEVDTDNEEIMSCVKMRSEN